MVLPPLLPPLVPQNPTRKIRLRIEAEVAQTHSGTTTENPKRYYRSESGTTAWSGTTALRVVLPLGSFGGTTAVGRGTTAGAEQSIARGKRQLQRDGRKDDGCDKDV